MKKLLLVLSLIALLTACGGQPPTTPEPEPEPDPDPKSLSAQQIAAGSRWSLALAPDGIIWAWGANNLGQLGNGTLVDSSTPTQVANLTDVSRIAAGDSHALALDKQGRVWAWGHNNRGQIGVGWPSPVDAEDHYAEPQHVKLPGAAVAVAAKGYSSFALDEDGAVWAWGDNQNSQLGDGSTQSRGEPQVVAFQNPDEVVVEQLFVGYRHVFATDTEDNIWYWGDAGYLPGTGTDTDNTTPLKMAEGSPPVANELRGFSNSSNHVLAVTPDGQVFGWGNNADGQLAQDDDVFLVMTPTPIQGLPDGVTAVAAGGHVSFAVSGGRVYSWGTSYFGELGDGTSDGNRRSTPAALEGLTDIVAVEAGGIVNSSVGRHVLALSASGQVYAWGDNAAGQLAVGGITESATPLLVKIEGDR